MPRCRSICILASFIMAGITAQKMLGAGKWSVLSVSRCDNDDEMPWRIEVRRYRLNRTHEAFSTDLKLDRDLDDTYALSTAFRPRSLLSGLSKILIDACKMMDGGCKPYMTLADDSLPNFVKRHAEGNVKRVLSSAGLDPPDFPIPAGEYHIENFILNTDDLPKDGLYGEYGISCYVMKGEQKMACLGAIVRYEPEDDAGFSAFG